MHGKTPLAIFTSIIIAFVLYVFWYRDEINPVDVNKRTILPSVVSVTKDHEKDNELLTNIDAVELPTTMETSIQVNKATLDTEQELIIDNHKVHDHVQSINPTKEQFIKNFEEAVSNGMEIDNVGGFGEFGKKIHSDDPQMTISISDLPPDLGNQLKEELLFKQNNGYEKTTDEDVYNEQESLIRLSGTTREIPHLTFELSIIPTTLETEYRYEGYIYPKAITKSDPPSYVSVKRVYKHLYVNDYIIVSEETLNDGSSHVITEFVNASVQECPAVIGEKRAPSGAGYGAINWASANYSYTITQLYSTNKTEGLLELANELAIANISTHQCTKSVNLLEDINDEDRISSF